ncbi:hypothetical protein HETIRDRAFT_449869 [Heterobasidion irregulare TC 32-1]|uniref:Cytochrome c oxidase subunit 8, mitochondrial n=1 Tax=Heterobasidion irregulare (strain TC 32-1) TaxID=747525 RepID=W4KEW9_HETIT|nr:uncharacterized protein HETIRDRAFT_449869 [Heterobasidion irregulare TC 32-1]ETW84383.1 hypothetical protein HETIRDRAFT_449869 [Heterobasidion irregulare TC 32-1]
MSILIRAPALRQQILRSRLTAPSRGAHGEYKHIPFKHDNKPAFAVKVAVFLSLGFSVPFLASFYQLRIAPQSTPSFWFP